MKIIDHRNPEGTERVLRLDLRAGYTYLGGVSLVTVDQAGVPEYVLLTVCEDGKIVLHNSVSEGTGLDLVSGGYVRTAKE